MTAAVTAKPRRRWRRARLAGHGDHLLQVRRLHGDQPGDLTQPLTARRAGSHARIGLAHHSRDVGLGQLGDVAEHQPLPLRGLQPVQLRLDLDPEVLVEPRLAPPGRVVVTLEVEHLAVELGVEVVEAVLVRPLRLAPQPAPAGSASRRAPAALRAGRACGRRGASARRRTTRSRRRRACPHPGLFVPSCTTNAVNSGWLGRCFITVCRRTAASHGEQPMGRGDSPAYLDEAATAGPARGSGVQRHRPVDLAVDLEEGDAVDALARRARTRTPPPTTPRRPGWRTAGRPARLRPRPRRRRRPPAATTTGARRGWAGGRSRAARGGS